MLERSNGAGPPKPTPMLCVGISGHRPCKLKEVDIGGLSGKFGAVLEALLSEMRAVTDSSADCFGGAARLRVLSAAAEGADRICARIGLKMGTDLQLILPFERAEYAHDFSEDGSRADYDDLMDCASAVVELDGRRSEESDAYLAAGKLIVELCDVLVAVWDGEPAAGTGGTADVVAVALASGRPVIWLNTNELKTDTLKTEKEPVVVVLRKDVPDDSSPDAVKALASGLATNFAPPHDDAESTSHGPLAWLKRVFQKPLHRAYPLERKRRWTGGGFFTAFRDLVSCNPSWPRMRIPLFEPAKGADAFRRSLDRSSPLFRHAYPALERLSLHYGWADHLSVYYGDLYRSGYTANYLLAACAVLFALIGIPWPNVEWQATWLELACIAAILTITIRGSLRHWHARWIAYRQLAEQLRTLRFLVLLCTRPMMPDMPKHLAGGDKQTAWVGWLYPVILREIGLPSAKISPAYLAAARNWITHREVKEQADYHRESSERLHTFDHRLHAWGAFFFIVTGIACVAHLVIDYGGAESAGSGVGHVLTFVSGALPAIGGAFLAIRNQGEFGEVAKQSERMHKVLDEIPNALMRLEGEALSREALADAAKQLAQIMLAETGYWHVVFLGKPLALPG
jgi:hypothetical protein